MADTDETLLSRLVRFLASPELVTHDRPTEDDLEAEKLIREVAAMYGSPEDLKIIRWGDEQVDWVIPDRLPALRTVGSIFHGLGAIKRIALAERQDWERAQAFKS